MAMEESSTEMLRQLKTKFRDNLLEFAKSPATFRILQSIPARSEEHQKQIKSLYVLDSSFNPPSNAHLAIAQNAVLKDRGSSPKRLLLLLATENADKKPKPADFQDRLVMMTLMAQRLRSTMQEDAGMQDVVVDVGVTKKPLFLDKANSIDESSVYGLEAQQVHLSGYDTVIRIFDPKYYPPDKKLAVLEPFLSKHRLRVCYRTDDQYVTREEQEKYVDSIGDGSREAEGMKREWRTQIQLVDDAQGVGEGVSSTRARQAVKDMRWDDLKKMVGKEMRDYIEKENLYAEP